MDLVSAGEDSAGKLVHRISFADAVNIIRLHAG